MGSQLSGELTSFSRRFPRVLSGLRGKELNFMWKGWSHSFLWSWEVDLWVTVISAELSCTYGYAKLPLALFMHRFVDIYMIPIKKRDFFTWDVGLNRGAGKASEETKVLFLRNHQGATEVWLLVIRSRWYEVVFPRCLARTILSHFTKASRWNMAADCSLRKRFFRIWNRHQSPLFTFFCTVLGKIESTFRFIIIARNSARSNV